MNVLKQLLGWRGRAKVREAFHAIAEMLFVHLQRQYASECDERHAMELATVVAIALLAPPPPESAALVSLPVDPQWVEAKLRLVAKDAEVCWLVSVFRHWRNRVAGAVTPESRAADERLRTLEVLLPADAVRPSTSHAGLKREIRRFEQGSRRV